MAAVHGSGYQPPRLFADINNLSNYLSIRRLKKGAVQVQILT